MSKSVAIIKKIVITVGDKEIALSTDEAKDLKAILDELFVNKNVIVINTTPTIYREPYVVTRPYTIPWQPTWPTITWSSGVDENTGTFYCDSTSNMPSQLNGIERFPPMDQAVGSNPTGGT